MCRMAQKRKVTPKKSKLRKSSRKSSKKQIPLYKLLVYCALAISFLILLYLLSDIIAKSPAGANNEVQVTSAGVSAAGEKKTAQEKKSSAGEKESSSGKKESATTERKSSSEAVSEKKAPAAEKKPAAAEKKASASEKVTQAPENKSSAQEKKTSSASQTQPPLPDFNFPQAQNTAKLVFVFDDAGQNLDHLEKLEAASEEEAIEKQAEMIAEKETAAEQEEAGNQIETEELPNRNILSFEPFGYEGAVVTIETDLRRGIPAYDIVGLADNRVKEAREVIKAAFKNSGFELPAERILQSLSPADLTRASLYLFLEIWSFQEKCVRYAQSMRRSQVQLQWESGTSSCRKKMLRRPVRFREQGLSG